MIEYETFDPIWEEKYAKGHAQRYPWDRVVSFVFRHAPKDVPKSDIKILEVGCGTGGNLWFAAREGYSVAGIDGSRSAIECARRRFEKEGLTGDLRVGDFTQLPFQSDGFHLVIDRGALVCCGLSAGKKAVNEVHRVLKPGGKFLFNPYSDMNSSAASGRPGPDGLVIDISAGQLVGSGQLCFYGRRDIDKALTSGWNLLSIQHIQMVEEMRPERLVHAFWVIIAEKKST